MKLIDLAQNSPEWNVWRATGIGSSDAPAIMGANKFKTPDQLLKDKLYEIGKLDSEAASWGHQHEDEARQLYHAQVGILTRPVCTVHDDHEWLRASLDGLSEDNQTVLEIKCPFTSQWSHRQALQGRVPPWYWAQVQHQLLVTGCERVHFFSYWAHDDTKFRKYEKTALVTVLPDLTYLEELMETERQWWDSLKKVLKKKSIQKH